MTLLLIFAALIGALAWLLLGGRGDAVEPTAGRRAGARIDYAELEQAEREVRGANAESASDWGPGTANPPLA